MSACSSPPGTAPAPAVPRPAATVILLRDGPTGQLETFMVRRDPRSRFAANASVFPGGTVQDEDLADADAGGSGSPSAGPAAALTAPEAHRRLSERGGDPPTSPQLSLALHRAAVRELFEEAGILLVREAATGQPAHLDDARCAALAEARPEIQAGRASLADAAAALGLWLALEPLVYFSHWITPESSPRRYDTRFFVVELPPNQVASHCGVETVDGEWIAPGAALARFERGEMTLVSVTVDHLAVLDRFRTVDDTLAFARTKPIRTVLARRADLGWDLGADGAPW